MEGVGEIIKSLKPKPAYLLILGLAIVVVVPAVARLDGFLLVAVVLGTVVLALVPILIDARSVTVPDTKERGEIGRIKDHRGALQSLFGSLLEDDLDTYIVYPSHPVVDLRDQDGHPIKWEFTEKERRVTTIVGAHAIARLQALLQLGGKSRNIKHVTSTEFQDDWWGSGLVLVGGPLSNRATQIALEEFKCPFTFSADMSHITQVGQEAEWPAAGEKELDYGIVANLKRTQGDGVQTCLIVAGLGAISALAGAYCLERDMEALNMDFDGRPFACLISVKKDIGASSARRVKSLEAELIQT